MAFAAPFISKNLIMEITPYDKMNELLNKIRDNNNELMSQVKTLSPDDQKVYTEKVSNIIDRTNETVSRTIKRSSTTDTER